MSSSYDATNFIKSVEPELDPHYFTKKDILWAQDQNNSNYSGGFINLDTSSLASGDRYVAYKEGLMVVPFTVAMQCSADISASANSWMMSLKPGNWNLIHSMSVQLNGTTIVEQQPFLNMFCNYKVLSTWSQDTLKKYGQSANLGSVIDSPSSFTYNTTSSVDGNGFCNNKVNPAVAGTIDFTNLESYNAGLYSRILNTSFTPATGTLPTYNSSAVYSQNVGQNFFTTSGSGTTKYYIWHMLCEIRLRDICEYFQVCPLQKRGLYRFQIGYNALSSMTLVITNTGTKLSVASSPTVIGATNPIMITSAQTLNPWATSAAVITNPTVAITSGIGSVTLAGSTITNPILTSVRLYVPAYTVNSEYEIILRDAGRDKMISYCDVQNYNVPNIAAGGTFNNILTSSALNPKTVVVIPQINAASNATALLDPIRSPFDTSPWTTLPFAGLYNFQVVISGGNAFQQAQQYDFDQFMNEMSPDGALNGGTEDSANSGLLSQFAWQTGYRYYVCDVGRRLPSGDLTDKALMITGQNNTNVKIDLYCFVAIGKKVKLNTETGEVTKIL